MGERLLILGRAGSGKTALVLEEFCHYVRDKKGQKALLLLPTYTQAEHLKDVIIRKGLTRGFIDKSLFTFSQLAREILDLQGLKAPISELEKELVLRHVLQENPLGYLADAWHQQGLRFSLLRFFKELKETSLYPQDFRNKITPFLEKVGARCNVPLPLREKCLSLVEAYSLFQAALEEKKLRDEDDLLNLALETLERDDEGARCNVPLLSEKELLLVDGFHDFTPVEFRILETLIQRIPRVYITLLFDPKERNSPIFERSREVYDHLAAKGFQERVLSGFKRSASPTLQHIERNLFTPPASTTEADDCLEVIEAVNVEDEVEQIARRIYQLVSEGGLRFNDIGVIFRDITPYYDLIDTIFSQYNIPVRVYAKRPLMESPLVKAIVQLTGIFTSHWEDSSVLRAIKSPYLMQPTTEVDLLECKALERGKLCTKKAWLALAQEGPCSNNIKGLFERLAEIEKDISGPNPPSALRDWFLRLINGFITLPGVTDQGQRELIKQESEALGSFLSLLDSHTHLAGREPLPFSTFWEGFLSTLSASSYAPKDKRHEVVNVVNALEARQWELSVVFVGGLLERQFPRQGSENLFLKDRERRRLRSLTGINLQEILKRAGEEERFLFYVALTRAKTKLILSYPANDSRGISNLPSFFLMEVKKLFSPKSFKEVFSQRTPSHVIPQPEEVLTSEDLGRFFFYYLGSPYRKGSKKEHLHYLARWIYNRLLKESSPWLEDLRVTMESPEEGDISPYVNILKELMPSFSATQFRDYAQCPYLHFCRHILRLESLPSLVEKGLDAILQGRIVHETLRKYYSAGGDIESIFQETFRRRTRGIPIGFREFRLKQDMLKSLKALLELDKSYAALLPLRPSHEYLERRFGRDEIPALQLQDRDLGTIRVSGIIDRIDVAEIEGENLALVIDYKYSKYDLNGIRLKDIEEGRDLQLPIYLMAAKECLNLRPLGAQFFYMKPPGRSGIFNYGPLDLASPPPLLKKGTHFTDEKGLEDLLETSREHLLKHAKGILAGNKSITPWDTQNCAEGRCDFRDVCRFEKWSSQKRAQ
ncbi:MAG: exodeoxyribonuclease V subunit gamma [Candidatus Brocadiales bacterium]|nr:exodeoxyribonuclease V subunit gamma [Candidatus Brocadiales bacterium]